MRARRRMPMPSASIGGSRRSGSHRRSGRTAGRWQRRGTRSPATTGRRDGWIRLHTNAPHHRAAAQRVLGAQNDDKTAWRPPVARWATDDLETAIVAAGGCAAQMRSTRGMARSSARPRRGRRTARAHRNDHARRRSPTGAVDRGPPAGGHPRARSHTGTGRPVASRFLAGFGADVLRIDPPRLERARRGAGSDARQTLRAARSEKPQRPHPVSCCCCAGRRAAARLSRRRARAPRLRRIGAGAAESRSRRRFAECVWLVGPVARSPRLRQPRADERRHRRRRHALETRRAAVAAAGAGARSRDRLSDGRRRGARHHAAPERPAAAARAQLALARTATLLVDARRSARRSSALRAGIGSGPGRRRSNARRGAMRGALSPPVSIDGAPMRWDLPACELGSVEAALALSFRAKARRRRRGSPPGTDSGLRASAPNADTSRAFRAARARSCDVRFHLSRNVHRSMIVLPCPFRFATSFTAVPAYERAPDSDLSVGFTAMSPYI